MRYSIFFLLPLLIAAEPGCANAVAGSNKACSFDENYFTQARYEGRPEVDFVRWFGKTREARIIARSGALVAVKHWSCDSHGLEAKALVVNKRLSGDVVGEQLGGLALLVLEKADAIRMAKAIASATYEGGPTHRVDVVESGYAEFFAAARQVGDDIVLSVKYSRN